MTFSNLIPIKEHFMSSSETGTRTRNNPSSQFTSSARQCSSPSRSGESSPSSISPDHIARRAYEIWERNGRPEGQSEQHWQQAEEELRRS
jgi:hypothetical protein